jgi:hypothetical protein
VFFNGVLTTPDGADSSLAELRRLHGTTSPAGYDISYEKMYNYTSGFEDFVETFEQRLSEQENLLEGRYELFFEALNGEGPWWSRIISSVAEAAGILDGIVDWFKAATIRNLTTLLGNPPTTVNYVEHRARLENLILEGRKLLLVAHSQGNLFVNAAYDYATTKVDASSVKVVHIAPASPTLRGTHILADLDLVINGLRLVGTVPDITDAIPGALLRPAGANGKKDPLGHGLLEIYINQALGISAHVRNAINTALTELVAPPVVASTGLFSATLTWDGEGDVDNVHAYGPEHYYASCSSSELQPGSYRIAVANFTRADNRTATVQIASWADGVLGTSSVTLGAETGDIPSATLFTVVVTKNAETGRYSISLAP